MITAAEQLRPDGATRTETPLVTVVYSHGRDLYRVAPADAAKRIWLSVAKFALPAPASAVAHRPALAPVTCGDGWRKAYSVDWSVVQPGVTVTLPATEPLVVDYLQAASDND